MQCLKKIALAAVLAAAMVCSAKELKVLTIGNSFADSAFHYLPSVVKSVPGCKIEMDRANIGGCTLERHWNEHQKAEKDPNYKPYGWSRKKRSPAGNPDLEKMGCRDDSAGELPELEAGIL